MVKSSIVAGLPKGGSWRAWTLLLVRLLSRFMTGGWGSGKGEHSRKTASFEGAGDG